MKLFNKIRYLQKQQEVIENTMDFYYIISDISTGAISYKRYIVPTYTNVCIHYAEFEKEIGVKFNIVGSILNRYSKDEINYAELKNLIS